MARKRGFFARLFGRRRRVEEVVEVAAPEAEKAADAEAVEVDEPPASDPLAEREAAAPEPLAAAEPDVAASAPHEPPASEPHEPAAPEPLAHAAPAQLDGERAQAILTGVLDDLGAAHHRPFSRA
jgi:hypothetical protein